MKVGSLYIILGGVVLGRYVKDDIFRLVKFDDNGNIVNTGVDRYNGAYPRAVLWSTPPKTRRVHALGDPLIILDAMYSSHIRIHEDVWANDVPLTRVRTAKYAECDANCKVATLYWLLISKRLCFPKDMRRYIGEMIWETRDAREWEN